MAHNNLMPAVAQARERLVFAGLLQDDRKTGFIAGIARDNAECIRSARL